MQASARFHLGLGAVLGLVAVLLGAFGAHALKGVLVPPALEIWQKASLYHFVHTLALIAVALVRTQIPVAKRSLAVACWSFLIGTILFSGSLYAYALTAERIFAMITPVGGTLFLVGWIAFAMGCCRSKAE